LSSASFKLEIDWYGGGSFGSAYSDVTSRVRVEAGVGFSRGKDRQGFFNPPMAGLCAFDLDNQDKLLSAGYSSSAIYGQVLPGRRVRLTTTSPARTLWVGFSDEIRQHPEWGRKSVEFACLGVITQLRGKSISTPLYQNIRIDQAIGYILDAIGWPAADRVLDTATVTLAYFALDNEDAGSALLSLLLTEGPYASVYEDGRGRIVFEANDYRTTETRCTVSQATFSDTTTNISFSYDPNYRDVVSVVRVTQKERQLQALAPIWTYGAVLTLAANETKKFDIKANDFFINAQVPSIVPSNATQTLSPSTTLTSGTFKLLFRGLTTSSLNYNASAATIQAALEALSVIGTGNVICEGGPINTTAVLVTFIGTLGSQEITDLITLTENALNPVSVTGFIEASETRAGGENPPGSGIFYVEVQALAPSGILTAGTFTLSIVATGASGTTAPIAYNATAATIQSAIRALTGFGSTLCFGGPINTSSVTVIFSYSEDMDLMLVAGSGLTTNIAGGSITVTQNNLGGVADYTITAGALLNKTLDRTSGTSCRLTLVADSAGCTLTGLQVRAQLLSVLNTTDVSYPTDNITDPLGLGYSPSTRAEISLAAAESLVESIYNRHHDAIPTVDIGIVTALTDATAVDNILAREISDLVTIVDSQTSINESYWIDRISHFIDSAANLLRTTFGCVRTAGVSLMPSVKKFRALVSQSSTSAPTAVVLQNDLGGTVTWSRTAAGKYVGTLTGAFPSGRTMLFPNSVRDPNSSNVAVAYRLTDNTFALNTGAQGGSFADGVLSSRPVDLEILVYSSPFSSQSTSNLYRALLTQSNFNAPSAVVLDNSFPGGVVWARDSVGEYFATTDDGFTAGQTMVFCNSIREVNTGEQAAVYLDYRTFINAGVVNLVADGGSFADDIFDSYPLDIQLWYAPGTLGELSTVKIYRALITQSGTSAPAATVLGNSLGGTPTYGRSGAGQYTITLTGAFPVNKTFIKIRHVITIEDGGRAACWRVDDNTLALKTGAPAVGYVEGGGAILGSPGFSPGMSLEVLVYP
jgi:hypothetical protein